VGAIGFAYDNRFSYAFEDPVSVELLAGITAVAEPAGAGLLLLAGGAGDRGRVLNEAVIDGRVGVPARTGPARRGTGSGQTNGGPANAGPPARLAAQRR
jgi:hypothetical protein